MTIQWVITSSILIMAVLILGRILDGRVSARLRYALWFLVLARLLIPVQLFTAPVNFAPQPQLPEAMEQDSIYVLPTGSVPVERASEVGAYITEDGKVGMMTSMGYARLENNGKTVVRYLDKVSPLELGRAVWKLGAAIMMLTLILANFSFSRRLRRLREPLAVGEGKLPAYRVEGLPGPCLFGFVRPAVYVTDDVLTDEAALRHVLAHESVHYRHGDHIWSVLRCAALAIHWWNPLVWLAVIRSRQDGELACDEGALQLLGDSERTAYGLTLLKLVSRSAGPGDLLRCTTTMTGGMKEMKRRFNHISCKTKHLVILSSAFVLVLSLVAACSFAAPKDETAVSREARAVIETMMTAPNKDLTYDAAYQLGSDPTEAETAAWEAEKNRVLQNWEKAVGRYFEEGGVAHGLEYYSLMAFQTRSRDFERSFRVADLTLINRDENREEIGVIYTADGKEHRIVVILSIGENGKFQHVTFRYADESADLPNVMVVIAGSPFEPDETAQQQMNQTPDEIPGEAVQQAYEALTANRNVMPMTLNIESPEGDGTGYQISARNGYNVEHVGLYLPINFRYYAADQTDWEALSRQEKGTVLTLKDWAGNIFQCCSRTDLMRLTMDGKVTYLRAERQKSSGGNRVYDALFLLATDAAISHVWDSATAEGSITDLEEVAELLMEQVAENYMALPSWMETQGKPLDVKPVESSTRVYDAYLGEPQQFCCEMDFRIALTDANTNFWQAGAGLSEPVITDGMKYYDWGRQVLVERDAAKNLWYIADKGTGGYSVNLPGYSLSVGTENYLADAPLEELLDMILLTDGFTHEYLLPKYVLQKPEKELRDLNNLLIQKSGQEQEIICTALAGFTEGEYAGNSEWTPEDLRELLSPELQKYLN